MENAPLNPEDKADDKQSAKKKKKAEALGAFLVEPKPEVKPSEKPEGLWDKLTKSEPAPEQTEAQEETAPLEELSLEEEAYVLQELIAAERLNDVGHEPDADLELAAVEEFRDKVLAGESTEQALDEALEFLEEHELAEEEVNDRQIGEVPQEFGEAEVFLRDEAGADPNVTDNSAQPPSSHGPTGRGFKSMGPVSRSVPFDTYRGNTSAEAAVVDNRAGDLLLGGIIGYLIGRRRGRIKAEKRLKPIQKKLTARVEALRSDLAAKEMTIRTQANQIAKSKRQFEQAERSAKIETKTMSISNPESLPQAPEESPAEPKGKQRAPEHIGHMLIDVEAKEAPKPPTEIEKKPPAEAKLKAAEHKSLTMSRQELLEASEKIRVDGTSLRQIYETRLVGERGLRRLVAEHLRGGDIKRQLRKEIVEREIDFERDPMLRDRAHQDEEVGSPTLKDLLKRAGADHSGESEEVAFYKARAAYEVEEQARQQHQRRALDFGLITIIVVLAVIITLLLLKR